MKPRASCLSMWAVWCCGPMLTAWNTRCAAGPASGVLTTMVCEQAVNGRPELKLLLFGAGRKTDKPSGVRVECRAGVERPVFWSAEVPVDPGAWERGSFAIVPLGGFPWERAPSPSFTVSAGVLGDDPGFLGRVVRANGVKGPVVIERTHPTSPGPGAGARVMVAATAEPVDARTAVLKVAFLNCGEEFTTDYSGFVHFDLKPTGEDLTPASSLGLHPTSVRTDTSTWRSDEVTVLRFGPFHVPRRAPEHVYVRTGLYDQHGSMARLHLAGSDDGTGRVLVGRFVATGDGVRFERLLPPYPVHPPSEGSSEEHAP